jgi:mRNA interferase MazF
MMVPYVINVKPTSNNGLDQDRYLDIGQIRGVDNSRVLGLIGVLEEEHWEIIHTALNIVLGFE